MKTMSAFFACFLIGTVMDSVKCNVIIIYAEIDGLATLPCKVSNQSINNTVHWYKKHDILLSIGRYSYSTRMSISHGNQEEWNINVRNVQVTDAGEYTCKAGRNEMAKVDLVVKSPPIIQETHDVTFEEGDTGILWCNVTGFPTPAIRWYWKSPHDIDGTELDSGAEGTRLVLHNITRYYDNIYICKASNSVGSNKKWIRVRVKFGPDVKVFQERITTTGEQELKLDCAVEAFPMEGELEWVYEKNGQKINSGQKYDIISDRELVEDFNTLFLSMVIRKGHLQVGKYVCRTKSFTRGYNEKTIIIQSPSFSFKANTTLEKPR